MASPVVLLTRLVSISPVVTLVRVQLVTFLKIVAVKTSTNVSSTRDKSAPLIPSAWIRLARTAASATRASRKSMRPTKSVLISTSVLTYKACALNVVSISGAPIGALAKRAISWATIIVPATILTNAKFTKRTISALEFVRIHRDRSAAPVQKGIA